jgi:4'-phosphopantetheinyl transferase
LDASETEIHLWRASLDSLPPADRLPRAERERAAQIVREAARRRWLAARWALRTVLAGYLGTAPGEVGLRIGLHGKPELAPSGPLRFNLSHSGELALIAVVRERDVGVDLERIGTRPAGFYREWVRREAVAKCRGTGLWGPPPDGPVAVSEIEAAAGFAAALATGGDEVPPVRWFAAEPGEGSVGAAELAVVPSGHT